MEATPPPSQTTGSATSASPSLYDQIGDTVEQMEGCLRKVTIDKPRFYSLCEQLIGQAGEARTRAALLSEDGEPSAIMKGLFRILSSDPLETKLPLQRAVCKIARLFTDLTFLQAWRQNTVLRTSSKQKTIARISGLLEDLPETEVNYRHELTCARASLRMLTSSDKVWGRFAEALFHTLRGEVSAGITEARLLSQQVVGEVKWITQVQYVYLFGSQWRSNMSMFKDLRAYLRRYVDEPNIALQAADTFAELIHNGSDEIAEAALSDEPSLITLASRRSVWPNESLWRVRYQSVWHLFSLVDHRNPRVREIVGRTLQQMRPKAKGEIKELFLKPELRRKMAPMFDATREEFRQSRPQEQDALEQLRQQLEEQGAAIRAKEEEIGRLTAQLERDRAAKDEEINLQKAKVERKEAELAEIRDEVAQLEKDKEEAARKINKSEDQYKEVVDELAQKKAAVRALELDLAGERSALESLQQQLAQLKQALREQKQRIKAERLAWEVERDDFQRRESEFEEKIRQFEEMEADEPSTPEPRPATPRNSSADAIDWTKLRCLKRVDLGTKSSIMVGAIPHPNGNFITVDHMGYLKIWDSNWNYLKTQAPQYRNEMRNATFIQSLQDNTFVIGQDWNVHRFDFELNRLPAPTFTRLDPFLIASITDEHQLVTVNLHPGSPGALQTIERFGSTTRQLGSGKLTLLPNGNWLHVSRETSVVTIWEGPPVVETASSQPENISTSSPSSKDASFVPGCAASATPFDIPVPNLDWSRAKVVQEIGAHGPLPRQTYEKIDGGLIRLDCGNFVTVGSTQAGSHIKIWNPEWRCIKQLDCQYSPAHDFLLGLEDDSFVFGGPRGADLYSGNGKLIRNITSVAIPRPAGTARPPIIIPIAERHYLIYAQFVSSTPASASLSFSVSEYKNGQMHGRSPIVRLSSDKWAYMSHVGVVTILEVPALSSTQ